ncbi:hypothetical protein SDC9_115595 [bioreactor metagenome]|uniref:Uncharacterized protein n=1 Tax=bioreactor metagenome TaxID=1076179 RepID=A0A645BVN7_9ZZZZ
MARDRADPTSGADHDEDVPGGEDEVVEDVQRRAHRHRHSGRLLQRQPRRDGGRRVGIEECVLGQAADPGAGTAEHRLPDGEAGRVGAECHHRAGHLASHRHREDHVEHPGPST